MNARWKPGYCIISIAPGWMMSGRLEVGEDDILTLHEGAWLETMTSGLCVWDAAKNPASVGGCWAIGAPLQIASGAVLMVLPADEKAVKELHTRNARAALKGAK